MDNQHSNFYCGREVVFENNYLQSIYLTYILGNKIGDQELIEHARNEITYLNTNKETILNSEIKYPEAYILKLLQLGLDTEYLQVIDNFQIPEYEIEELEHKDEIPILSTEERTFLENDQTLFLYSDYALLFKDFNKIDLSEYFKYELIQHYNALQFGLYPLCTVVDTYQDGELDSYLKERLENVILEGNDLMLLNSFEEMLKCKEYFNTRNIEVKNLDLSLEKLLRKSTINIDGNSYLIDVTYECIGDAEDCTNVRLDYNLLTNLKYILYE